MKKYITPHIHVEAINPAATILLTSGGGNEPKASGYGEKQIYAL